MSNTQVALELVQKLKNLELIVEESVTPLQNGSQGYYNINQQLVNQKQEQKAMLSKTYMLFKSFSTNMLETLSTDLKLNYLKKKTSDQKDQDLNGQLHRARHKWERLTHFMLNIDQMQYNSFYPEESSVDPVLLGMGIDYKTISLLSLREKQNHLLEHCGLTQSIVQMLVWSDLVRENAEVARKISDGTLNLKDKNVPQRYNLSSTGFHYVLLDTPTQVHSILQNYIKFIHEKEKREKERREKEFVTSTQDITVELIKIILNFALSEGDKAYKLRSSSD